MNEPQTGSLNEQQKLERMEELFTEILDLYPGRHVSMSVHFMPLDELRLEGYEVQDLECEGKITQIASRYVEGWNALTLFDANHREK